MNLAQESDVSVAQPKLSVEPHSLTRSIYGRICRLLARRSGAVNTNVPIKRYSAGDFGDGAAGGV